MLCCALKIGYDEPVFDTLKRYVVGVRGTVRWVRRTGRGVRGYGIRGCVGRVRVGDVWVQNKVFWAGTVRGYGGTVQGCGMGVRGYGTGMWSIGVR